MGSSNYSIIDPFHVGSKVEKHFYLSIFFFCSALHTTSFSVTLPKKKKKNPSKKDRRH